MSACAPRSAQCCSTRYKFLEFADPTTGLWLAAQLTQLRAQIGGRFSLHLGQGWRFFAPEDYITHLTAVLDAEPQVFQVGINFADATKLTGASAVEKTVRRAPDAGRYVLTDVVANGPAMLTPHGWTKPAVSITPTPIRSPSSAGGPPPLDYTPPASMKCFASPKPDLAGTHPLAGDRPSDRRQ